ncbi:hypothetical protein ['Chrysanthemum coronarium' phytoplasma]|uniref:Uncharacterized protein n=2 Tax=16SrI (Aster yellows group) TaxID=3042590 RepID=B9A0S7_ONYPH|nr:hypothetical protein ['Chrysanthemum coronarium' phytoplasma]BAH22127.1 hypothetical protein [Onion yellows phytoplasma]GAK74256.1 predicted phosphohydrolase ['Chrysanthemum coronarium' phytoplasma]
MFYKLYQKKLSDFSIEEIRDLSEFIFYEKIKKLNYLEIRDLFFKLYNNDEVHTILLGANSCIEKHPCIYQSNLSLELHRNNITGSDDIDFNNDDYKKLSYKFYTILELFNLGNVDDISQGWNKLGNNIKTVKDVLEKMN